MKEEREFLNQLYKKRIKKIPFIEYFQNDKYLRKSLFDIQKLNKQSFLDNELLNSFNEINKEIKDFKNLVLNEKDINSLIYSESFAKSIIYKLEIIQIPKLTKLILRDFVDEVENVELLADYIIEYNDHSFEKQYNISIEEAERKYRELKRFADNYFIDYLKDLQPIKKIKNSISEAPQPKQYLKDLFKDEELYDKAIEILIEEKFISKGGDSLNWIFPKTNKYQSIPKCIVALCIILEKKEYFITNTKTIYNNIENEFNVTIDKSLYSRYSTGLREDYQNERSTNYSYLSLFKDKF